MIFKLKKISLIVALLYSPFASSLTGADFNQFYSALKNTCVTNQSNYPVNSNMSVGQINQFCSCTSNYIATSFSYDDLAHLQSTGDKSRLESITHSAGSNCSN